MSFMGLAGNVLGSFGGVLGGIGNYFAGQDSLNQSQDFSSAQAALNRQFQTDMRANQYQTSVADMKQAGLNPEVMYAGGGAGAGNLSGAVASSSATQSGETSSAAQAASLASQIQKTVADTSVSRANEELIRASIPKAVADTRLSVTSADATRYLIEKQYPWLAKKAEQDTDLQANAIRKSDVDLSGGSIENPDGSTGYDDRRSLYGRRAIAESSSAESGARLSDQDYQFHASVNPLRLRSAGAGVLLDELQVPGARNQADYERSTMGGKYSRYLPDLGSAAAAARHFVP